MNANFPNFFLVGAPKAGTTSLYHHLDQHPQIFMSPMKETFYFSAEMRPANFVTELQAQTQRRIEETREYLGRPQLEKRFAGIVENDADYRRLFSGAREQPAIGEATPCYLWSKTAPQRIAECVPHAKIIMILRDPAQRAFSQYVSMITSGGYRCGSFRQHLAATLAHRDDEKVSMLHPFLEYGLYADQLERYRQFFPAAQIGLWLYEDTRSPSFLPEVFSFLGVDCHFMPDTTTRHLEPRVARIRGLDPLLCRLHFGNSLRRIVPPQARSMLRNLVFRSRGSITMTSSERSLLIEYYRPQILRLQATIGRDLSAWLC